MRPPDDASGDRWDADGTRPEVLMRSKSSRGLAVLACALALLFPACGGGGGGGGSTPLAIATTALPPAGQGVPYSTTLAASGGTGPYAWSLGSGSVLPDGLALAGDGTIAGSATTLGTYSFSVVVTDASAPPANDSASYSMQVSPFSASISSLHWGEAWTTESYPLGSVGGQGTTFTIVSNASGGSIANANPSLGTATYVAGPSAGTDTVRATSGAGPTQDLVVPVQPHPVKNMTAKFSSTDVWHLRFDGKADSSHLFANDFDSALATAGLRGASSFDAAGTTADQVARAYVRQQTLRYLNVMYRNNGDGSAAAGGLAISFPYDEPTPPHFAPADGTIHAPATNQFNVISLIAGSASGVVGTAYLDSTSNVYQENDTSTPSAGDLGVFVDEVVYYFDNAYSNAVLPAVPVNASDVPALKALLYGTSSPGGRYLELKRVGEGFGRTMAAVAAHEIGHSLGLEHTIPPTSSSIMNAAATFGPGATYDFVASDFAILQGDLPGPGRGGSPQVVAALVGPGEGSLGFEKVPCRLHVRVKRK